MIGRQQLQAQFFQVYGYATLDANEKELVLWNIPVPVNSDDPNDAYFRTSNNKVAYPSHSTLYEPICWDALPEGDRIYHSIFLDNAGEVTFAQWLNTQEIENRLRPLEERIEQYSLTKPANLKPDTYFLTAQLNYKRMPDSFADFLEIDRQPEIQVPKDIREIRVKKGT